MSFEKRFSALGVDPATYGKNLKGEKVKTGRKTLREMSAELCKSKGMKEKEAAELCAKGFEAVLRHFEPKADPKPAEASKASQVSAIDALIQSNAELSEAVKALAASVAAMSGKK
jgi:hypothetical protein